ncbi:MAG: hypothetical protein JWM93_1709 [Frankiales bacterium]|nr:hypothetical protein [Frankiales bacterium]
MTDLATTPTLAPDALERVAAAQADWVRRHTRVAMACAGGFVLLAIALTAVLLLGTRDTVSPQAVLLNGTLLGLVASALAASIGQARYAERARRLAVTPPPPVACYVERLAADTKKRQDHLNLWVQGSDALILMKVEPGTPLQLLPERGDAVMLGTPSRNQPVLVGVPGRPFVAARRAR